MAISSQTSQVSYTGNASASTPYPITFRYDDSSWVTVEEIDEDGAVTTLALGSDYTLSGDGSATDGEVITGGGAIPATSTLRISRNTPRTQTVSLVANGQIPSAVIEAALDRETMALIDEKRRSDAGLSRSLRVRDGETLTELVAEASRAGKFLGFDDDGQPELKTADEILAESGGAPDGIGIPDGGTTRQALRKTSATDYAADWSDDPFDYGSAVSSDVFTLLEAHRAANANCTAASLRQWAWCLNELEAGGILDELAEGVCLRPGFNTAAAIKGIRNTAATITGTQVLTPDGLLFPGGGGAASIYIELALSALTEHTVVTDFRYSPDAPADSAILCLAASGGTNSSGSLLMNSASLSGSGTVFTAAGGSAAFTAAFGSTESALSVHRYNPNDTIAGWSHDNAATSTLTGYVNGVLVVTDASGNYQATANLVNLTIGARNTQAATYDLPMDGTVAVALVFNRVLTAAEHLVAAKAVRHLDPRKINLVTYGDSRTTHLNDSAKITGNWPYQYAASPQLARTARLCNIANNGWTASTMSSSFAARGGHLGPNGTSILETRFYLWTGANDWLAPVTGATAWSTARGILRAARALGMRATLATDPEGGTTYTSPQEAERVAYNVLARAGLQEWDSLWDLDAALVTPRNVILWLDQLHLNNTGNKWLAEHLHRGGLLALPKRENTVTLDQDATRNSTTTLTDVALAGTTAEGLAVLGLSIAANERVGFEAELHFVNAVNPMNIKAGISVPSGATYLLGSTMYPNNAAAGYHWGGPTAISLLGTATGEGIMRVSGTINNGATAGNVVLQLAQFASTGVDVVLKAGSTMRLVRRT